MDTINTQPKKILMNTTYRIIGYFNELTGKHSAIKTEILGEFIKNNDKTVKIRCNDGNEYLVNRNDILRIKDL
jgi:hypothetical protein